MPKVATTKALANRVVVAKSDATVVVVINFPVKRAPTTLIVAVVIVLSSSTSIVKRLGGKVTKVSGVNAKVISYLARGATTLSCLQPLSKIFVTRQLTSYKLMVKACSNGFIENFVAFSFSLG